MGVPAALHYQEPRWSLPGSDPLGTARGECDPLGTARGECDPLGTATGECDPLGTTTRECDPVGTATGEHTWHLFPIPCCSHTAWWPPDPAEAAVPWCKQLPLGVQTDSASATTGFAGDTTAESRATFKQMCKCVCPLCWEATAAASTSELEHIPSTAFISLCHPPRPHLQLKNSLLI